MTVCGGVGGAQEANDEVRELGSSFKAEVEEKEGKSFDQWNVTHFASQVVAGVNYFIKVDAGDQHIHLRVYKPLPHTGEPASLHSYQAGKTAEDPVTHF